MRTMCLLRLGMVVGRMRAGRGTEFISDGGLVICGPDSRTALWQCFEA